MTWQTSSRSLKAIIGVAFAAVGLLLLFVNLDNVAADLSRPLASPAGSLDAAVQLGLAAMRTAHGYFFEPSSFQSGLRQILVSFWPLILVIFGGALLQSAFSSRLAHSRLDVRSAAAGAKP